MRQMSGNSVSWNGGRSGVQPWVRLAVGAALVMSTALTPAHAKIDANVTFVDDGNSLSHWYDRITSHVNAALAEWGKVVLGDATVDVEIKVTQAVPRSAASSKDSAYIRYQNGLSVYAPGAIKKINEGVDVNGPGPDLEILVNPLYIKNELWFDPDPMMRSALVPDNKTDAVSVFMHEVGHALGYNGWGDSLDGGLPGDYASTWDMLTEYDSGILYFVGERAKSVYGGRVPITFGNNYHVGNGYGPGMDLLSDVMNGVVFYRGTRYEISPLNVAMLQDMGVAVQAVPEPETLALMLAGLGVLFLGRRMQGRPGR